MDKKELVLSNDVSEVSKIENFTEQIGEELSLSPAVVTSINLALEEAIANVIMYAYPAPEKNKIHLFAELENNELMFLLTDTGVPFDPTKDAKNPDITASVEDRPIGGLGIMLVKKIMNEVSYQRINGENQLTLKKKI
jgi:serine/threonine-protein kinase RsbW